MNISDTVSASATAKDVSEVVPPFSAVAFTRIGSPTTASTSSENDRFSRASRPNAITRSSWARSAEPGGSSFRALARIASAFFRPSTSKFWPRKLYWPPLLISASSWSASFATRFVSAPLAVCTCALIVFSTNCCFAGSSAL